MSLTNTMKEINIYHVILGAALGAGGVVVGMKMYTLVVKKRKKKRSKLGRNHPSPKQRHFPSLIRSPGIYARKIISSISFISNLLFFKRNVFFF